MQPKSPNMRPLASTHLLFIFIILISVTFVYLHNSVPSQPQPQQQQQQKHLFNENKNPTHPLDPLTFKEITTIKSILSSHSLSFPTINSISLVEPEKATVLSWAPGHPLPPRLASVIASSHNHTHLLTINISANSVLNHAVNPQPSGYPFLTSTDMANAVLVTIADVGFVNALKSRNLDLAGVTCAPLSPGWFGKEEEGYRLVKVQCFVSDVIGGSPNVFMRPVEGLTALVNLDAGVVVRIVNRDRQVPVNTDDDTDYRYKNQPTAAYERPVNPMSVEQEKGPSYTVEGGHVVKWAGWEFHVRPDARAGMVVSRVRFVDPESGEIRDVLYKGMVSELFVPYMDPSDEGWYFKSYLDAGEYGLGLLGLPLVRLNDCPRNAYYMDAVYYGADGSPFVREDVVCLFERYAGDVAWRHSDILVGDGKVSSIFS